MREDLAHVARQQAQQAVLDGREVNLRAVERDDARGVVDDKSPVAKHRRRGRGGCREGRGAGGAGSDCVRRRRGRGSSGAGGRRDGKVALRGANAREKLTNREGLAHVVVGAGVQRADLVRVLAARADHDDGHDGPRADGADDLDAVDVGKPQVKQDDVRRGRCGERDSLATRGRALVRVAVRVERGRDEGADLRVVLDHEDGGHSRAGRGRIGRSRAGRSRAGRGGRGGRGRLDRCGVATHQGRLPQGRSLGRRPEGRS